MSSPARDFAFEVGSRRRIRTFGRGSKVLCLTAWPPGSVINSSVSSRDLKPSFSVGLSMRIWLLAALLLTVAEVLVFEYDARQNVVLYQAEAASALAARG